MEILSLSALQNRIGNVLQNAFPDLVWLEAEISRVYEKNGHFYLELVEKKNQTVLAKASSVIWRNTSYIIRQKLRGKFDDLIQAGINVKVLVDITFHPVYGMNLVIKDLDPEYTMGQMELMRKRSLLKLKTEGLLDKNSSIPLPQAIKRVAIISSNSAAGFSDFMQQLHDNRFRYTYECKLFQASMQGELLKEEVIAALREIQAAQWDVICIIRGGGSRVDLAWFDNYELAVEIAHCKIPVITGIGHEIDKSVADYVAHTAVKTPTAAAEFLLSHNHRFEEEMSKMAFDVSQLAQRILEKNESLLSNAGQLLFLHSRTLLERHNHQLAIFNNDLKTTVLTGLEREKQRLDHSKTFIELVSPEAVLKKGYTIIRQGDHIVKRATQLQEKMDISIQFYDSEIKIKQ